MLLFRNCPKAIWISISMVTVVYTFANIAYFTTVSREEVLSGAAVAVVSLTDHIMKNEIIEPSRGKTNNVVSDQV